MEAHCERRGNLGIAAETCRRGKPVASTLVLPSCHQDKRLDGTEGSPKPVAGRGAPRKGRDGAASCPRHLIRRRVRDAN